MLDHLFEGNLVAEVSIVVSESLLLNRDIRFCRTPLQNLLSINYGQSESYFSSSPPLPFEWWFVKILEMRFLLKSQIFWTKT